MTPGLYDATALHPHVFLERATRSGYCAILLPA